MMIIDIIVANVLMLLPVYGEAVFDSCVWYFGWFDGKDKPISTWLVRPLLFLIGFFFAWQLGDKEWWRVVIVMIAAFVAWFPLLINWIRGEKAGYLGKGWYDTLVGHIQPSIFRVWLFIWLYIVTLCIYYYYELYYNLL